MTRKEKLRKQHRMETRKERRAVQAVEQLKAAEEASAEIAALIAEYPEDEGPLVVSLIAMYQAIGARAGWPEVYFLPAEFCAGHGITELDEKRVLHILALSGLFNGYIEPEIGKARCFVIWYFMRATVEAVGLDVDSRQFLQLLERVKERVPGLKVVPHFDGRGQLRERIPYKFNFSYTPAAGH